MIFKTLSDITKQQVIDEEIHEVIVKRDVVTRKDLNPADIIAVSEVYNEKGRIYKSRCVISMKDGNMFYVKHKFDDVVKLREKIKIKGFGGK